ncbi:uncharacterized protein [Primulina huaijiensis]|uniref:uncharacterized protein n=1 Tax=Primulina huaijiensis TaxID=1492673 RepID=UPI003CC6ED31
MIGYIDMEFKHFSHEHPLIFNEEKNVEDEINDRNDFCNICNIPILLSSFYRCSHTGCKYLLHQPCALLLTETLIHHWLPSYGFRLREKRLNDPSYCKRCHLPCENFTYNYITSWPGTGSPIFHPMCAIPLQIKSKHKSHPLHPLVAVGKKISAVCDACTQEQKGDFFACHECGFFIHVDCALLPRIVKCKEHSHYLILTYACCDRYQDEREHKYCLICSDKMSGSGAYSCGKCNGFVHLKCAIKEMEDLGTETELQVVDLPGDDPNAFRSGMIQRLRGMEFDDGDGNLVFEHKLHDHPGNLVFEHKLHDHPLILHKEIENSGRSSNDQEPQELIITLCNACLQPIYPPFFSCTQSLESGSCHFHLHQSCACLPSRNRVWP